MDDHRSPATIIALVILLGAIVGAAYATEVFDDLYYAPICRRYAEVTQLEFVAVVGVTRHTPLHCSFNLYYDDGSLRAVVDVPMSRIHKTPAEYLLGPLRWAILVGLVVPAVWLARNMLRHDD
jgi:hypothetical protein